MNGHPLSVLHFANSLVRGGVEEHILSLLRGMDRRCFRLYLACPETLVRLLQPDLPPDVEVVPLTLRKPSQVLVAARLARILVKHRIDVLHSHLFFSSLFASPIGRLCRVPVIVETPHIRESWRRGWFKSRFFVDRLAGRCVDYYIAVSGANARYLADVKGLPERKIVVVRNGCDLQRFAAERPQARGLRESLGFESDDPVLVVLGRLEPQKGHRVLLESMAQVRDRFPRARLVCVGEGSLRQELEAQSRGLGLSKTVHFVGYQSNPEDWLAMADATVLPSFYEGLPLVAIESLAARRPLVATDVDGTPEVVINEKTGFVVPPGDPRLLAGALCRLIGEPETRLRMGHEGQRWVFEHFDRRQQIQQTQELYQRAWLRRRIVPRGTPTGDEAQAKLRPAPRP